MANVSEHVGAGTGDAVVGSGQKICRVICVEANSTHTTTNDKNTPAPICRARRFDRADELTALAYPSSVMTLVAPRLRPQVCPTSARSLPQFGRGRRRIFAFGAIALGTVGTPSVSISQPLDPDAEVDLFQGPLLAPLRVLALGGAYGGYGEDLAGMVANAASTAVRPLREVRHVEFGASGSVSIPIDLFENNDFDNSGDVDNDYSDFVYVTGGLVLKVGSFGLGATSEIQRYEIAGSDANPNASPVTFSKTRVQAAWGGLGGQLNVGGGVRLTTMGIGIAGHEILYAGASPELGLLVKPVSVPFRFGVTYRLATIAQETIGSDEELPLSLPDSVVSPWELETGISFQLGPRPFNIYFSDPEDADDSAERAVKAARDARRRASTFEIDGEVATAREENLRGLEDAALARLERRLLDERDDVIADLPRERVLVLLSVLTTGPVEHGVSIDTFLSQADGTNLGSTRSGGAVNFSPRFGIEAEAIPNWLVLRGGSYYEPSRFGGVGRQHFTFGASLRVFSASFWGLFPEWPYSIDAAMDLAPRYESVSASIALFR